MLGTCISNLLDFAQATFGHKRWRKYTNKCNKYTVCVQQMLAAGFDFVLKWWHHRPVLKVKTSVEGIIFWPALRSKWASVLLIGTCTSKKKCHYILIWLYNVLVDYYGRWSEKWPDSSLTGATVDAVPSQSVLRVTRISENARGRKTRCHSQGSIPGK